MTRDLCRLTLIGMLAFGFGGSSTAATLSYTGTLSISIGGLPNGSTTGTGLYAGPDHIYTIGFTAGQFGPLNSSIPVTASATVQSLRISNLANLPGNWSGLSGSPPGGGTMGLSGVVKICLVFAPSCSIAVSVPLSPVAGVGLGIGGTQTVADAISLTMQHNPWTIGQPTMTIHSPASTLGYWTHYEGSFYTHTAGSSWQLTTGTLGFPKAFGHGPATGTTSTALPGGALQLISVTKVYSTLTASFPELPVFSVLNLEFFALSTTTSLPTTTTTTTSSTTTTTVPTTTSSTTTTTILTTTSTTTTTTTTLPPSAKVTLCHKEKSTLSVGATAAAAHLAHGDTLGVCP